MSGVSNDPVALRVANASLNKKREEELQAKLDEINAAKEALEELVNTHKINESEYKKNVAELNRQIEAIKKKEEDLAKRENAMKVAQSKEAKERRGRKRELEKEDIMYVGSTSKANALEVIKDRVKKDGGRVIENQDGSISFVDASGDVYGSDTYIGRLIKAYHLRDNAGIEDMHFGNAGLSITAVRNNKNLKPHEFTNSKDEGTINWTTKNVGKIRNYLYELEHIANSGGGDEEEELNTPLSAAADGKTIAPPPREGQPATGAENAAPAENEEQEQERQTEVDDGTPRKNEKEPGDGTDAKYENAEELRVPPPGKERKEMLANAIREAKEWPDDPEAQEHLKEVKSAISAAIYKEDAQNRKEGEALAMASEQKKRDDLTKLLKDRMHWSVGEDGGLVSPSNDNPGEPIGIADWQVDDIVNETINSGKGEDYAMQRLVEERKKNERNTVNRGTIDSRTGEVLEENGVGVGDTVFSTHHDTYLKKKTHKHIERDENGNKVYSDRVYYEGVDPRTGNVLLLSEDEIMKHPDEEEVKKMKEEKRKKTMVNNQKKLDEYNKKHGLTLNAEFVDPAWIQE